MFYVYVLHSTSDKLDPAREPAHIRAFFVHPDWARRGFSSIELAATLPGEPFYAAFKFSALERYDVPLTNGLSLPVVRMRKYLTPK